MFDLSLSEVLGFSVLAAIITTCGSLLATVLKEFLFTRSLEKWKAKQNLRQVYLKFRDPLLLATIEMVKRFQEIAFQSSVNFLDKSLLDASPQRMKVSSADDEYYQRYKFVSTIYRLCSWLGWIELYRQEVAFLASGHQKTNADFERHLEAIRSSLADGFLNNAENWGDWTDSLIFREEQRAIGERMIESSKRAVLGYGSFCDRFMTSGKTPTSDSWIQVATNFLVDLKSVTNSEDLDFRRARCLLLIKHGCSLIECLNKERFSDRFSDLRTEAEEGLKDFSISVF